MEGTQRLYLAEQKRAELAEAEVKRLQTEVGGLKESLQKANLANQEKEKEKEKELEGVKQELANKERELRKRSSSLSSSGSFRIREANKGATEAKVPLLTRSLIPLLLLTIIKKSHFLGIESIIGCGRGTSPSGATTGQGGSTFRAELEI